VRHVIFDQRGKRPFPPFVALEIVGVPGRDGCYFFHICVDGQIADTWHGTVAEAVEEAEYEFGVKPDEWTTINAA